MSNSFPRFLTPLQFFLKDLDQFLRTYKQSVTRAIEMADWDELFLQSFKIIQEPDGTEEQLCQRFASFFPTMSYHLF